jgi:predicted amidophosphoribosyltransferase
MSVLKRSVSKHNVRIRLGKSASKFEQQYMSALEAKRSLHGCGRVLVIDDVATEGSTLKCAFQAIRSVNPKCEVLAATAGLMAVKAVVRGNAGLMH